MAEKMSTLVVKLDLDCNLCYKKIRKVLCHLQDKERIRSITFDDKNSLVTLSGLFDPQNLSKKLNSKAGDVITDIQIKDEKKEKPKDFKPTGPPAQALEKPKEKEKPKLAESAAELDPPKAKPAQLTGSDQQKYESRPPMGMPMVAQGVEWAYPAMWAGYAGPVCGCGPSHDGWYRCYTCGREWAPPVVTNGSHWNGGSKGQEFFAEEDPSCVIM